MECPFHNGFASSWLYFLRSLDSFILAHYINTKPSERIMNCEAVSHPATGDYSTLTPNWLGITLYEAGGSDCSTLARIEWKGVKPPHLVWSKPHHALHHCNPWPPQALSHPGKPTPPSLNSAKAESLHIVWLWGFYCITVSNLASLSAT